VQPDKPKKAVRELQLTKFVRTPEGIQEVELTEEEIEEEREKIKREARSEHDEAIRLIQDNIYEVIF
jgi:predicted Zn-dependent peptidase